jgi:uncharacterized protein YcaQ
MVRTLSLSLARRLAVSAQALAGECPPATPEGILNVARQLGCLQLDPISAVTRSHQIVVWSRVGHYDLAHLDTLLWRERSLFEYWAHAASIVLTEDYPIHRAMMLNYPPGETPWALRTRAWVEANDGLRQRILSEIREKGPLPSRHFEHEAMDNWVSTGWTNGRNVGQMIDHLWIRGDLMVAGRSGLQKLWDLSERCLPGWTQRDPLPDAERVRLAAEKALRSLGVARANHIQQHYIRGRYPELQTALDALERDGRVEQVAITRDGKALPGVWYMHSDSAARLDALAGDDWGGRTTLLSPFDNLICDRKRTQILFDFDFTIEIYVPKAKRRYGYYVLPILSGERLIGRIDPLYDRKAKRLVVNAVYAEPDAPDSAETARDVRGAIESLAGWLGAREVDYAGDVPPRWAGALRG